MGGTQPTGLGSAIGFWWCGRYLIYLDSHFTHLGKWGYSYPLYRVVVNKVMNVVFSKSC